ncbi:MAG: lysophospholipid acyltransferase family protein [Candidatus Gastranaerophilales bacterium]|nr:lysophospholipid acyltransferase family protein [Candidatus Gastranaerophilales bacterium]
MRRTALNMITTEITEGVATGKTELNKPQIKDKWQLFWLNIFEFAFSSMLKKAFFSVRIKNKENYDLRDKTRGCIIFASHCCWWDGLVAYTLSRKVFNTNIRMMVEELHRFPLLSRIGAFSVDKNSPQAAVKALNYCTEFLNNPESVLWIYPQGTVKPPDYRPVKFASGMAYLCSKLDGINLIPIAHRYNFLREDRPEVFIEVGKPIILDSTKIDRKEFTAFLEREFTQLLDKQKNDISEAKLEGYEFIFKSRLCVAKLIEKYFNWFVRSFTT